MHRWRSRVLITIGLLPNLHTDHSGRVCGDRSQAPREQNRVHQPHALPGLMAQFWGGPPFPGLLPNTMIMSPTRAKNNHEVTLINKAISIQNTSN